MCMCWSLNQRRYGGHKGVPTLIKLAANHVPNFDLSHSLWAGKTGFRPGPTPTHIGSCFIGSGQKNQIENMFAFVCPCLFYFLDFFGSGSGFNLYFWTDPLWAQTLPGSDFVRPGQNFFDWKRAQICISEPSSFWVFSAKPDPFC